VSAATDTPTERVTHALVRDVDLTPFREAAASGAGDPLVLGLITLDNGEDHTKPNTLGPIGMAELKQFPEYHEFRAGKTSNGNEPQQPPGGVVDDLTPEEHMEYGYSELRKKLVADILDEIAKCPPEFFERLVVELLVAMGYGGSRADAGRAVGRSGDGGIDGIIKEDRLGLDVIYIQAKRWEGTVGRPEIQKFAGALQGERARKGIFITSSSFSGEALKYAANIDSKIILIDGATLAGLMIDHDVGVTRVQAYEIKRLDSDYFQVNEQ